MFGVRMVYLNKMQEQQVKKTGIKSACLVLLFLVVPLSALGQFGRSRVAEVRKERIEVDVSRPPLGAEAERVFTSFYNSFIEKHHVNDEGEFESGNGVEDSASTRSLFLHYVSKSTPEVTITLGRRCQECLGNSKVWVKVNPDDPLSLAKVEVDCEGCPASGLIATEVTYRFFHSSGRLPELPEKPKVTKLRNLIVKALAGEADSQLKYANMLENGAPGVPKDLKLARQLYAKSFVSGSSAGLDGLIRIGPETEGNPKGSARMPYVMRLVQAKLNSPPEVRSTYDVNSEVLGVEPPQGLSYIESKIAEIEARTVYSYFKTGDLKLSYVAPGGLAEILRPLKLQMEKIEPVTAHAKVDFVLVGYALEPDSASFGSDRLKIIKQAAISMDPTAYAVLGDVSQRGLVGVPNPSASAVFYSISRKISKSALVDRRLSDLESRFDAKKCSEMLEEFERTKSKGLANPYFIDAVLKLEP